MMSKSFFLFSATFLLLFSAACGDSSPEIDIAKDWASHEGEHYIDRTKKAQKQNIKDYKNDGYKAKGSDVKWVYSLATGTEEERRTLQEESKRRVEELSQKYGESSELNFDNLYIVRAEIECTVTVEYDRGRKTVEKCKRAILGSMFSREYATAYLGFLLMVDTSRQEVLATHSLGRRNQ